MPFPKGALHPSRKRAEYVAARDARKRESKAKSNAKRRALDVEAGAVEGERASRSPPPYAKRTKAAKRGELTARVRQNRVYFRFFLFFARQKKFVRSFLRGGSRF